MNGITQIGLADLYGNAGLEVDPDRFEGREAAVNKVASSPDIETLTGLAAIAFGFSGGAVTDRIVAAVREGDPSFSSKAHAHEIRILAVGVLEVLTTRGWSAGMHAVLALSACGQRACEVDGQIVSRMEGRRRALAVDEANYLPDTEISVRDIKIEILEDKIAAVAAVTPQGGSHVTPALQDLFETFNKALNANRRSMAMAIQKSLSSMNGKFERQQNELDLLWWLFGGWSDSIEAPFEKFEPAARGVLIGIDLGQLSDLQGGPAAIATFAERAMGPIQKSKQNISFEQIIGALDLETLGKLDLAEFNLRDRILFPVLGTLKLRHDRAVGADETSLYDGIGSLEIGKKHDVLRWVEHVYHEMTLARIQHDGANVS